MTLDEYSSLRSLKATLENAFAQDTLFWMRETLASGLMSLDCLVNAGKKQHEEMDKSDKDAKTKADCCLGMINTFEEFTAALYAVGWRDTCDAQHENVRTVYNEWRQWLACGLTEKEDGRNG